ncbi:MAG: hypothetical protein MJ219_01275 [Mycoplasmoidaceae bacterium]|nr:hypothetical protein [Mycoplasmoidaceae bacterium]
MILQPPQADEAECNLFSVDAGMDRGDDTVGGTINGFQLVNKPNDFNPTNTNHASVTVEEELPEDEGGLGEMEAQIICTDDNTHTYAIQFFSKALNPKPGNHKVKVTIKNKKEGSYLLQTTTFDVNASFEVDT